jgi:hypothetical protein
MTKSTLDQGCLFEEDFLRRTLGAIANAPEVALTELVANAWDAGATEVKIVVPEDLNEYLTIEDDGTGMSEHAFRKKWMTLGSDRIKHQGGWAEFPHELSHLKRPAYGRNGVGRHGMLCFASEYEVKTWRDMKFEDFLVEASSGKDPFRIAKHRTGRAKGHGTLLKARVTRNLPGADRVAAIISARFLHDPQFNVSVNGKTIPLAEHEGLIDQTVLTFGNGCKAEAFFVDSTRSARTTQYQGVAFWVGGRLVGDPAWTARNHVFLDGRTRIAKRYTVIVKTEDLFDDVLPDWTDFKKSSRVDALFDVVGEYVQEVFRRLSADRVQETTESVIREHISEIRDLSSSAKMELQEFVSSVTKSQPTIPTESLSAAVRAVIDLEKTRIGSAL